MLQQYFVPFLNGKLWRGISLLTLVLCLTACGGAKPRSAADQITLERLDGARVSLTDYQGQVVLVNFWATWCGPCREEMPALDAFYQRHQQHGFVVLAVNAGEPPERVRAYLAQTKYTFPTLLDPDGSLAAGFGGLRGMPTSFVLNGEGEIVRQHVGALTADLLAEYVTPLLAQEEP